jgi:hypothetical protein
MKEAGAAPYYARCFVSFLEGKELEKGHSTDQD